MKSIQSMQHWNGNLTCVVDVETTGLVVGYHEIIQLAILPLDHNFKVLRKPGVLPLKIHLIPEYPERIDTAAMSVHKIKLKYLQSVGLDQETAKDVVEDWFEKLDLPFTKYGSDRCRVIPMGHNVSFDIEHLKAWMGVGLYESLFHHDVIDTMRAAQFMNDRAAFHADTIPFPKRYLKYMCSTLDIPYMQAHDALQDCLATAEVYRRMMGVFIA